MIKSLDDAQKVGKDGVDAAVQSMTAASKGAQTIAAEVADYSRKSFEQSAAAFEKLVSARSLENAFEVQTEFARSAYESFVTEATKLGSLYADIAKETYKPYEGYFSKMPAA